LSSISIVSLLYDITVKNVNVHTFQLKHDNEAEKESIDAEKSDSRTTELFFNTFFSFQTISTRMTIIGPFMHSYLHKCLTVKSLEEFQSVTPYQVDQTIENFEFSQEEWLTSFLLENTFDSQKKWMKNVIQKSYAMRVIDFGICIETLYCYLSLMLHSKQDYISTGTDLKDILLKSMPLSWQNAYMCI
jgi:hypothetical protein